MSQYHKLSDIHPSAQIGKNVTISAFVTIQADVVIGDNVWIGPNVSIMDGVRIGSNCKIFHGAILGADPQDLKYQGEESYLIIGNNVTIREYCTLNRGTSESHETRIGDNCLLMAYVHVAHDCHIHNNCILANNVTLAGHIEVFAHARLGGLTAVHQFVDIGSYTMISGGSLVRKSVPPYITAARDPLSYVGLNSIGLKRAGFTSMQINEIKDIYRILFIRTNNIKTAIHMIQEECPDSPYKTEILNFITHSERGIIRGFRQTNSSRDGTYSAN